MKKHIPFVIHGDFSKEFLEAMECRPFIPELIEVNSLTLAPLVLIEGLYPKIKNFEDVSRSDNTSEPSY